MAQSLVRQNRTLSALLEVSRVLNSSFELEKNLSKTMRVLGEILEMERGSVFLLDQKSRELKIVAAHGLTKEQIERGKYRIGEGIVSRVIEKGTPLVIPNVGEEPLFLNKTGARIGKSGISFLCAPISFKGRNRRQVPSEEQMDDENFVMPESREIRYWLKTDKTTAEIEDVAWVDLIDKASAITDTALKALAEEAPAEKEEDQTRVKADVETSDSVRIPVSRLDTMLNLVGELVIANSGFLQIQDTLRAMPELGSLFKDVRDRTKELARISGVIQGLVMNSRLVPISLVFNRFKRFVRDYSTKSGKKIKLTMSGEATELRTKKLQTRL